jgi:formate dehydrogenase subunit gamma
MSAANPTRPLDPAVLVAREKENVLVGNEIVRHRLRSRVVHWVVAATFFGCLLTGMPIWTPVFGWMAHFFGGLSVCRVIHPWLGFAFFGAAAVMTSDWRAEMSLDRSQKGWWGPRLFHYLRWELEDEDVGKYNEGQKFYFWTVGLGALGVTLSGLIMWFPRAFPPIVRQLSFIVHDLTFILFAVAVIFHIYLSTSAEPGTFRSMTRGTVTRKWARLHHPRWFRDVTGEDSRRG